ncbi:unnamed protein product [Oikopleura dioica]|uniref:Uncharacterized protein n=1 Tax=Oikopleura dioica TaxID=34765 RepID=E4X190_OIKDI|nr:unnamed protein product [Oikopleura dioica]CBY42541.1 unnamed protein product [Oikopleura dioica]
MVKTADQLSSPISPTRRFFPILPTKIDGSADRIPADRKNCRRRSENADFADPKLPPCFTTNGSATTDSRNTLLNMEISALKEKVYHLEINMGTLLRKYNILESEISKMKNESPKDKINVLNSLHMLKAFQNGSKSYDLELERKENVTMMEGSWSFEYKLLESDPLLPSPPRSHILLSGDFKKAKLQAKSVTRRGKEITISEPHDYDQGSCLILTFAKHFTHKKLKLSIFLI